VAIVFNDGITYRNAFITDIRTRIIARRGDELTNYILAFVTKRTAEGIVGSGALQAGAPIKREIETSLALIGRIFITSISTVELFHMNEIGTRYVVTVLDSHKRYQACF
jgi:hypothetical protein